MVPGWSIIASEVLKNCPDASVMNTRPVLGDALFNPHRFRQPEFLQQVLREVESPSEGTLEGIVDAVACDTEEDRRRACPHPSTPSAE